MRADQERKEAGEKCLVYLGGKREGVEGKVWFLVP